MALIVVGEALEGAVGDAISQLAVVVALLNLLLALLNLLPVYPLDGGRILHAALWPSTGEEMRATRGVAIASRVLGWGLLRARGPGDADRRRRTASCSPSADGS